jgi:hypothetical protein
MDGPLLPMEQGVFLFALFSEPEQLRYWEYSTYDATI